MTSKIKLRDFTIAFDELGSGLPLLFIHGFPLNRHLWEAQWSGLSDQHRIIIPDLRGHGDSTPGRRGHSMEQLAQDCVDLVDQLGIRQPLAVCGLSMGGYVVMAMLRLYPERISAVILIATRSASDTPEAKTNREKSIRQVQQEGSAPLVAAMLPRLLSPHTLASRADLVKRAQEMMFSIQDRTIVKDLRGLKNRLDSTALLSTITKPVLIIHGEDDQIVPLAEAQALQRIIPGAQIEVISTAGHLPNLEQPLMFNQAVHLFLKNKDV